MLRLMFRAGEAGWGKENSQQLAISAFDVTCIPRSAAFGGGCRSRSSLSHMDHGEARQCWKLALGIMLVKPASAGFAKISREFISQDERGCHLLVVLSSAISVFCVCCVGCLGLVGSRLFYRQGNPSRCGAGDNVQRRHCCGHTAVSAGV
jgi:hypothetical protein